MGAGKGYSAGAIFLQVVPVFNDVQRAIESEAKDWDRVLGDRMEKAGERAGEKAGKAATRKITAEMEDGLKQAINGFGDSLGKIDVSKMGDRVKTEVRAMRKEIEDLSKLDVNVGDNLDDIRRRFKDLRGHLSELEKGTRLKVDFDGLVKAYTQAQRLDEILSGLEVDVDTKAAERQMGAFERQVKRAMEKAGRHVDASLNKEVRKLKDELEYLSKLRVGVDIGSNQIRREVGEILTDLKRLSIESPDIDVRFEAGRAWAELAAWEAAVTRADGRNIDVKVDVDTDKARRGLNGLAGDGEQAANSFRSFNIYLFAAATGGPALIPVLAGIAGGLAAIGPAAGVAAFGLGSVLVGFSGIGNAVSALQSQQEQAAMTAQTAGKAQASSANAIADAQEALADARRNAARAAEDAAERVADAREAAAEAIEAALERQRDAQEAYRDSVDSVREAEQALRDARAAAAGQGHDIEDRQKANNLAIDQAVLDSFAATESFNATMADGSATNVEQEQARINREQALLALHELREEQAALAKEKAAWDKDGVNGTKSVKDAQENLNDALDAQKESYEDLRDAAEDVDKTRADGAENVRDAIEAQNETLADNARAIEDAREALARARQGQDELNGSINAQQQAVDNAMAALGPAGERFARFIFGLRDDFNAFRDDIQKAMLPDVQRAIEGFLGSGNGAIVRQALINLADAFGRFAVALSTSLQGTAWQGFFEMLRDLGPVISDAYGGAFIAFMEAMASIMTTLAPFAVRFAEGFERIMVAFADWAASEEGQDAILRFMAYVEQIGPKVLDFFVALVDAVGAVLVALAPWGEITLEGITSFLEFIADMDPTTLAALATAFVVLMAAAQNAYAIMNLFRAGGALLFSTVGIWVFAILGIVAALTYLYTKNEDFRDFVNKAWDQISEAVEKAWDKHLKPALNDLMDALTVLWEDVLQPFFEWFGPILVKYISWYLPLMMRYASIVFKGIAWIITNILVPVIKGIAVVVIWLWEKVLKPTFSFIGKAWSALVTGVKWVWNNILKPVFTTLGKVFSALWHVVIKVVIVAIKAAWKALTIAMRWAWENILRPVWNAIKKAANWLWTKALRPTFNWIGRRWDEVMRGMKWVWNRVLKPVFDFIADRALPKLKGAFETAVDGIKTVWDGLKKIVGTPIKFVLDTVINNGLIAGFNKVAGWVGEEGFEKIPIPKAIQKYATGGILPGYTPGRDVHSFVSPTAGRLELSGGEAIMRPEWTAAMGAGYVNQMNAIARAEGVSGLRKRLMGEQAFARGGIYFPVRGGFVNRTAYNLNHDGMDINHPNDGGPRGQGGSVPFVSATPGRVTTTGYSRGYGNAVFVQSPFGELVYGHAYDGSIAVKPGQSVSAGQYLAMIGNTGRSSGPHLHFGFPGGTFGQAEALLGGALQPGKIAGGKAAPKRSVPGFIKDLILHPIATVKGWVTDTWKKASEAVTDSPAWGIVKQVPTNLVGGIKDKAWDLVPGWAKTAVKGVASGAEKIGGAIDSVVPGDGVPGFAKGGILPYNGTMMYDNGGYLPPGLTTVMNLTGKPEPVFTHDQWADMGAGGSGGNIHYEPHFEGSNLTPEDVAADLNFTFRRIRRGGKYAGVGQ